MVVREGIYIPDKMKEQVGVLVPVRMVVEVLNGAALSTINTCGQTVRQMVLTLNEIVAFLPMMALKVSDELDGMSQKRAYHGATEQEQIALVMSMLGEQAPRLVYVDAGWRIAIRGKQVGIRLPSYIMENSRIGLAFGAAKIDDENSFDILVTKTLEILKFTSVCRYALHRHLLKLFITSGKKSGGGIIVPLFYSYSAEETGQNQFLGAMMDGVAPSTVPLKKFRLFPTKPMITVTSNQNIAESKYEGMSAESYFDPDSNNMYIGDIDLCDEMFEIFSMEKVVRSELLGGRGRLTPPNGVHFTDKLEMFFGSGSFEIDINDAYDDSADHPMTSGESAPLPSSYASTRPLSLFPDDIINQDVVNINNPIPSSLANMLQQSPPVVNVNPPVSDLVLNQPLTLSSVNMDAGMKRSAEEIKKKSTKKPKTSFLDGIPSEALTHD